MRLRGRRLPIEHAVNLHVAEHAVELRRNRRLRRLHHESATKVSGVLFDRVGDPQDFERLRDRNG